MSRGPHEWISKASFFSDKGVRESTVTEKVGRPAAGQLAARIYLFSFVKKKDGDMAGFSH